MKRKKSGNTLLWRLHAPGTDRASYLFGTVHLRDPRVFGWMELARPHLEACQVFAAEFDFDAMDAAALQEALRLPEGQSLETLLKPGAWKNLDHQARKKLGTNADALRHEHPMTLSTAFALAFLSETAPRSLDEQLWDEAGALGLQRLGVETFAQQLATLRTITLEQHLHNLSGLLKHHGRYKRRMRQMLDCYVAGDLRQLFKAAKRDSKGMRSALIYRRNQHMARAFADIAREKPLFCAVGAGHLPGGKGMLRLLKQRGFRIEPIFAGEKARR